MENRFFTQFLSHLPELLSFYAPPEPQIFWGWFVGGRVVPPGFGVYLRLLSIGGWGAVQISLMEIEFFSGRNPFR